MNNNLKNLKFQPDNEVWTQVNKTIKRRILLRRVGWTSAIIGVVGLILFAAWPKKSSIDSVPMETLTAAEPIVGIAKATAPEVIPAQTETIVKESKTPSQVLTITEQPIIVEEPELETSSENSIRDNNPATNVEIIGGADGPTAILVVEDPQPSIVDETSSTPQSEIQPSQELAQSEPIEVETVSNEEPQSVAIATSATSSAFIPKESILWIPNAFAPESDIEENRTFRVVANDMITDYRIYIYDRSGRRVYESEDINASWNGTKGSIRLPQAAYVYVINYKNRDGHPFTERGTVTLIR